MYYNKEEKTQINVYNKVMNLGELKNKTILLFGKSRAFGAEEFESQLKYHGIKVVKEYNADIAVSLDGRMMTPYEQNASDELYENKNITSINLDIFEKALAKEIDEDTLLMSLKLSHDKDRLKSFLQNSTISDKLFFRLLKLYSWNDEDFFENDNNRDVSAAFISRFYENIERNHNVEYATTGFIHLVSQTKDIELLKAILWLKPLKFHPKIKSAIAMSSYTDEGMQKQFFKTKDEKLLEALSFNKNLTSSLVKEFLDDEVLGANVARSINLDDELFDLLKIFSLGLAVNETLSLEMQEKLLSLNNEKINFTLAQNNKLNIKTVKSLIQLEDEKIKLLIYENNSTPVEILQEAYKEPKNHIYLSKNENTPIEILYQLQLDSRFERFVKTNAAFGRHIQSENIGWEI